MSWRVWQQFWIITYTSDDYGEGGEQECREHFQAKYAGNVHDSEWRVMPGDQYWPATLQLKLPSVVAEYRDHEQAEALRDELAVEPYPVWVTELGSPIDRELEQYGQRKLSDNHRYPQGAEDRRTGAD